MLVSDYNYNLPEERIAKFPPKVRGTTRLLVIDRKTGELKDSYYKNLDEFLNPGDVLIINDTKVMKSRLFTTLPDGRERELVVLERHGDEPQRVMYRGKLHEGDVLAVNKSSFEEHKCRRGIYGATEPRNDGSEGAFRERIFIKRLEGNGIAEVESDVSLAELADKYGNVPLPPYLHRDATKEDVERYQTVWAKNVGSAAAPTASLNMTDELLERLTKKGVIIKKLTLHVGLGTFLPMRTDNVEDHKMHSEWFNIPDDTLEAIKRVREAGGRSGSFEGPKTWASAPERPVRQGRSVASKEPFGQAPPRVIAVGTTVARTLEYYAKTGKTFGEDDIFIYPGFEFKIVDALLTNFHAPKSTVLMLASAFAGWEHLHAAYDYAVEHEYNFLSYGDSTFIC